jgi:diguanylate cyclase (GGDEF)-like protein
MGHNLRRIALAGALALQILLVVPVPTLAGPLGGALGQTVDEALGETGGGGLASTPEVPSVQVGGGGLPQVTIGGGQTSTTPQPPSGGGGSQSSPQGSGQDVSSPQSTVPTPPGGSGRGADGSTGGGRTTGAGRGSGASRNGDQASRARGGSLRRSGRAGGEGGSRSRSARARDGSGKPAQHRRRDPLSLPAQVVERIPAAYRLSLMILAAIASIFALVTLRERRRSERATQDALSDPLTGLSNRLSFEQQLALEWKRAQRYEHPLGLLLIDLDDFKQVNDTRGHAAGDRVLREAAATISGRVRETDVPARIGGDEFVVICPETSQDGLEVLARKLRHALAEHAIGASVGVAERESFDAGPEDLLARADEAMYAKKRGSQQPAAQHDTLAAAPVS